MTVLLHRLLDAQGRPVAGKEATLTAYDPIAARSRRGVYQRTKYVISVSDNDGWLRWTLPPAARSQGVPSYAISGIEDQSVLVTVPVSVSTATVTETRTGTLTPNTGPATADLVTEAELAIRLAGSGSAAVTPEAVAAALPARLSDAVLRTALVPRGELLRNVLRRPFRLTAPLYPSPPTVTIATTATITTPKSYAHSSDQFDRLGMVSRAGVGGSGGYIVNDINKATPEAETAAYGVEGIVSGPVSVFGRALSTAIRYWVFIDDQPLTAAPVVASGLASGTNYYIHIPIAAGERRRVRVMLGSFGLRRVDVEQTGSLFPAAANRLRVAIIGTSFTIGGPYASALESYCWKLGEQLGVEVFQSGVSGSGYVAAPAFSTRTAAVAAALPDVVIVEGSGNDIDQSAATVQAAASSLYANLYAALPKVPVVVFTPYPRGSNGETAGVLGNVVTGVQAAALAAPNVKGFVDAVGAVNPTPAAYASGANYAAGAKVVSGGSIWQARQAITAAAATLDTSLWSLRSWLTGTGYVGAVAGDGSRDVAVGADGLHPTNPIGHDNLAANVDRELRRVLAA